MSGIIAVYGLVVAVVIHGDLDRDHSQALYTYVQLRRHRRSHHNCAVLTIHRSGFMHLGAGLSVGFTGLAAGYAIGIIGDAVSPASNRPLTIPLGCLMICVGRARIYATIPCLRRNDSYSYFC